MWRSRGWLPKSPSGTSGPLSVIRSVEAVFVDRRQAIGRFEVCPDAVQQTVQEGVKGLEPRDRTPMTRRGSGSAATAVSQDQSHRPTLSATKTWKHEELCDCAEKYSSEMP